MKLLQKRLARYCAPQECMAAGLYPYFRAIQSDQDTEVILNGKKVLMFGSNSYLGLTNHPKVKEASKNAIDKYGTGCAGSRFLNGTLDIHIELENRLAKLVNKEGTLCYGTGYQANLGVVSSLTDRNDYLIFDECNHASIFDGSRLSFSKVLKFEHNNMGSLESKLKICNPDRVKLIVVDGVFSMDGDIIKLPELVKIADKYGASIMIDDAHSLGVIGDKGAGTASHFGLSGKVDIIMGTFSKTLASLGGFIASDKDTINYLKHNSRSLIYSASMTPASVASVLAALDIMESEPERIVHLWNLTNFALKSFKEMGFNIGRSETPIIPLFIGNDTITLKMTRMLLEDGVFVNPIVSQSAAKVGSIIRFSLMATHTFLQLQIALEKIERIANKLGVFSLEKMLK